MYIKNLKLVNFRNYHQMETCFSSRYNIIYGDNAQGKTNILESIFLCASGRSHRTSKDTELVRLGEEGYYVKLEIERIHSDVTIEIAYKKNEKKNISINEIPVKRIGEMVGKLNAVMFSPEDLLVIKHGPAERRRFLDITLSQIRPSYFYDLQQYGKIVLNRNMLLKEIQKNRKLIDTLDIWNESLVKTGSRIISSRNKFLKELSHIAEEKHGKLTMSKEKFALLYMPSVKLTSYDNVEEIEEGYKKKIKECFNWEMAKCSTMLGPHRDDYGIFLNDMNARNFGSQGQQRTAALTLKLSEIDIIKDQTGELPVLLLDDVMSELDEKRQNFLLENINEVQTFITCTDKKTISQNNIRDIKYYHVKEGNIME